jgi:hypothetical protein
MIEANPSGLIGAGGPNGAKVTQMVITAEWELKGATTFLEDHTFGRETVYTKFLEQRLQSHKHEFGRKHLIKLLEIYRLDQPIRQMAKQSLADFVETFPLKVTDEPIEMSEDLGALRSSIDEYGFGDDLNAVLTKIDDALQQPQDEFDQVSTMRHIRSFFETLHAQAGEVLRERMPSTVDKTPLKRCGQAIDYLERKGVITAKIKDLGQCLYRILSDDGFGVHAIKAKRDYTRLCRNMAVEYAVTLFLELEYRLSEPGSSDEPDAAKNHRELATPPCE